MLFLRQIGYEIKNILKSKFILIIGILILAICMATPIISFFNEKSRNHVDYDMNPDVYYGTGIYNESFIKHDMAPGDGYYGKPGYPGMHGDEPILIDGVTINYDNPFYGNIQEILKEKEYIEETRDESFSSDQIAELALSLLENETSHYVRMAKHITDYRDYRSELLWQGREKIYEKFIYEHNDIASEGLYEAVSRRFGHDYESFKDKFINITSEKRLEALEEIDGSLGLLYEVVEKNDFPLYIRLSIEQEKKNIENLQEQIAIQERHIIDNPSHEKDISNYIEQLKNQIEIIETNNIHILEYRLEKNIIPGEDIWQNVALSNLENYKRELSHNKPVSEEEFNDERYLKERHKTYTNYLSGIQTIRDEINNQIIIAEKSLEANKPDMKFAPDGIRNRVYNFLTYSNFVAMFAILLGGWLMASEFQQGTIRLLMIRPKTRTKILMSKFIAAFLIFMALYASGCLLNMISNGICFGFKDFSYPNFTISGQMNFLAFYLPKFFACIMPALFTFSLSFFLSVLIKNIAVAIIIPIASFLGSSIVMQIIIFSNSPAKWLTYTPIPYMDLTSYFGDHSIVRSAAQRGIHLSLGYGISILLILSAVFVGLSIFVFKKKDIAN